MSWLFTLALRRLGHGSARTLCFLDVMVFLLSPGVAPAQITPASLRQPAALAFDPAGDLYIADRGSQRVWKATLAGTLELVAGSGTQGFGGDGGPATAAMLNQPQGLAVGPSGELYIADTGNQRIRLVAPSGEITTLAGDGVAGYSGDGGPAAAAHLRSPTALALGANGTLFFCDSANHRLRAIQAGLIHTVAGSGIQGFAGDGGSALTAELDTPSGIAVLQDGTLFIADRNNQRIRLVSNGLVRTFAGTGTRGLAGDGGPALQAQLSSPSGLAADSAGSLLVADAGNQRLRRITPDGLISTVAGSGVEGASPEGATATSASLDTPRAVAISAMGIPAIADFSNGTVRELTGTGSLYRPAALASGRSTVVSLPAAVQASYGQGTLPVTVTGLGSPQGQLQLTDAGTPLGQVVLSGGRGSFDLSGLPAGPHQLLVSYAGDGLNPASLAPALQVTLAAAPLLAAAAPATIVYGSALPSFSGTLSGLRPADAQGVSAVFGSGTGALPGVGSYPITASLAGPLAGNYTVVMAPGSGQLTVTRATATATLSTGPQDFAGLPASLSVNVAANFAQGQPTGTVQFLDGDAVIGSGTLQHGSATIPYMVSSVGIRPLRVLYSGDANFLPGGSPTAAVNFSALPDFVMASMGGASATVPAGTVASFQFSVGAQPGPFTGAVALTASGLPSGTKMTFSPPLVVPGSGIAVVTASVQTQAPALMARATHTGSNGRSLPPVSAAMVPLLVLSTGLARARRRSPRCILPCGAGLLFLLLLSGCGARTVTEGNAGLLAQTYTITVTGTATNLAGAVVTHSVPFTLTVQQ